ncbi:MAG TPA: hypothetical protein VIH42_06950 [Thermoguttaceae bacterium]
MSEKLLRIWFVLILGLGFCSAAVGADFRVENGVYSGSHKEPISQSLTVFHQGVVYDFLQEPAETIVFDKAAGRFTILDDAQRIRSELTTTTVDSFIQKLKDRAGKLQDPLMRFFADPVFIERFDPSRGELLLQSPLVNYLANVSTVNDPAIATEYREFADHNVRLSALLIPGSRPPFARLKLNDALARRGSVAREVILTIALPGDKNRQPATIRSEHILSLELSPADLERIQYARQSMSDYKLVAFDKYRQSKR